MFFSDRQGPFCFQTLLHRRDYNISPSRYIHTSDAETYRPVAEIVEELDALELVARDTDEALRNILRQPVSAT